MVIRMDDYTDVIPEEFICDSVTESIQHGIDVSNLAYQIAQELGMSEDECHALSIAGVLHDIGKLKIRSHIYDEIDKSLTVEKLRYIRMHAELGYDILIAQGYSEFISKSVKYHHENYDGSGYPENLSGDHIPVGARILRVCDVFSALTSDRSYRKAFEPETAVELMIDEVKNFDMQVFLAFLRVIHDNESKKGSL